MTDDVKQALARYRRLRDSVDTGESTRDVYGVPLPTAYPLIKADESTLASAFAAGPPEDVRADAKTAELRWGQYREERDCLENCKCAVCVTVRMADWIESLTPPQSREPEAAG